MIIDVNGFIGKWPYWPLRSTAPEEVAAELRGWKIDRAAICSTRSVFVNWEDGNREALAAAGQDGGRFIPFACLGPRELSHKLRAYEFDFDRYQREGFRGIRLYPQHHSYHPLYEPFVDEIADAARSRNWPVLMPLRIIMNWGMPVIDMSWIAGIVERHPQTTWILAGINYLHELRIAVSLMRRYPSVHLETSCVMGYTAIAKLVEECGAAQLLFGSGAPVQHGGAGLAKILGAAIGESDREAILGGNAARLLGL